MDGTVQRLATVLKRDLYGPNGNQSTKLEAVQKTMWNNIGNQKNLVTPIPSAMASDD